MNPFLPIDRRRFLRGIVAASGGAMLSPLAQPGASAAVPAVAGKPKRVVFFLTNQGLKPAACRPKGLLDAGFGDRLPDEVADEKKRMDKLDRVFDVPLVGKDLPEHFAPLVPIAERVTIIQGLCGRHVRPFHSATFAALAGAGDNKQFAAAETIDCALGRLLPAPFPMLGLGWGSLPAMQRNPIVYCSSAWGRNKPAPLYSNPIMAHTDLFGAGGDGTALEQFRNDTEALHSMYVDVQRAHKRLSEAERAVFRPLVDGFDAMKQRREQLADMKDMLRKHAPAVDAKFTAPQTDLDWKQASFESGCAALIAGLTNVLTIACGNCGVDEANGPFRSLGTKKYGHDLGHSGLENDDWIKVYHYESNLLVSLVKKLEAVPEGNGTMMDNTVIVYTSSSADKQHTYGERWPFVLIGSLGGKIKTGRFLHYPVYPKPQRRSINALYATLLHAAGAPRDSFNLEGPLKGIDQPGPLEQLLV